MTVSATWTPDSGKNPGGDMTITKGTRLGPRGHRKRSVPMTAGRACAACEASAPVCRCTLPAYVVRRKSLVLLGLRVR